MDYKYKQLDQELSALNKAFSELGARLSEVAKEVAAPGVNPSEKLIEQISAARARFENVRSAVHGHAGAMLVSPLPKLPELVSIATIDSLLKASAIAEETKYSVQGEREKALAILGRVLAISHRESGEFKPLQDAHARIGELRSAVSNVLWPHRHPESETIVGSKHPTTALLYFVENLDQLDDERWMALETTITESYGKPLFVAASRGKLQVAEGAKPAAQPAASQTAAPAPTAPKPTVVAPPEPAKPAAAAEKPAEKKVVVEKAPEKPAVVPAAPAAPAAAAVPLTGTVERKPTAAPEPAHVAADKAPLKPTAPVPPAPVQTAPTVAPEKKQPAQPAPAPPPAAVIPAPAATAPAAPQAAAQTPPVAVAHTPAAVAPVPPAPSPAIVPAAPAPVAATPVTTRAPTPVPAAAPSAPVATTPVVPAHAPAASPAPSGANGAAPAPSPMTATMTSLTALATATEPIGEKKPAVPAPVEVGDKQRKEPRLAAPPSQVVSRPEPKPQEAPEASQPGINPDGSQRPQRWGFWRGNR